jgi:hypothetical protein
MEAEPLCIEDPFGRAWRMDRLKRAVHKRVELEFADEPYGLSPTFGYTQALRTINRGIAHLYLDILQEGLPSERLEAKQRLEDLESALYIPPNADCSELPF